MSSRLSPGLYENLLTEALQQGVAATQSSGDMVYRTKPDPAGGAELIARHVYDVLLRILESQSDVTLEKQTGIARRVFDLLNEYDDVANDRVAQVENAKLLLQEVVQQGDKTGGPGNLPRPTLSLRQTSLLVNGRRDVQMGTQVAREIQSADRIDLLCAFIRHSGLRLFHDELRRRVENGTRLRVITSTYTGTTERRALDALVDLGAKVKISYEKARTRLHAKAWLFHRNSNMHTAYIGSSNLTHTAQVDGLEWNVRVSAVDNPDVIERFRAVFEQYWQEPEFQDYDPERDAKKLDRELDGNRGSDNAHAARLPLSIDVAPKPHQEVVLEALESERARGHHRNLVVAATGTGKTWISAFDFARLRSERSCRSLLFVAHRKEILEQSQLVFQLVLHDPGFGEFLVGGTRPEHGHCVFASIQSLTNIIDDLDPHAYDVVVIDEFHHAAARSYTRLLDQLKPKFLLGLTATPERADGKSVLDWFDGRIASESRLWDALDLGLLCPFHYFGVNDPVDLSGVRFERGRYVIDDLDKILTGDDMRARQILNAVQKYVTNPHSIRALGFCASINHARFMADRFTKWGYPSVALDATTDENTRQETLKKLRHGDIRAIFAVDLFNEGVDIPSVDTLLLLRPTESATVFIQQLGRGLRWAEGKHVLTVLDMVGQVRREYRYEIRYRALVGGTRHQIRKAVECDFPVLPPGCAIKLDAVARKTVLENLRQAVNNRRQQLAEELCALGPETRLAGFMRNTGIDLREIYNRPAQGHSFSELRNRAGFADSTVFDKTLAKATGRLLHVDDSARFDRWRHVLRSNEPVSHRDTRNFRLDLMLCAALGFRNPVDEMGRFIETIRNTGYLRQELLDLFDLLEDQSRNFAQPVIPNSACPLSSHATYTRQEVLAAYDVRDTNGKLREHREGVLWVENARTDLLFVTLEKSEADYSPTTRYADYPVSPVLFHWESQSTTAENSPTGQRYIKKVQTESDVVLFVRERRYDDRRETHPFHCLGRVNYVSHESNRPISIIWQLERAMPGWLFQAGRATAG